MIHPPCRSDVSRDPQNCRSDVSRDPHKCRSDVSRDQVATWSRLTSLLRGLLLVCPRTSLADYQAGLDAYAVADYHEAMREWKAVAAQPASEVNPAIYAEVHYAVARLYWDGLGTTRDYFTARDWLEKAAGLGHAGAMAKLGFLYTDGIAVEQDFDQAFAWYSKAAKLGDVDALYNLGVFYLNGWGTTPDRTMAKQYLAAASAQGDPAAEQALQQLLAQDIESTPSSRNSQGEYPGSPPTETKEIPDQVRDDEVVGEPVGATSVATFQRGQLRLVSLLHQMNPRSSTAAGLARRRGRPGRWRRRGIAWPWFGRGLCPSR